MSKLVFNYLNFLRSIPLNFSEFAKGEEAGKQIIIGVGKSAAYMRQKFIERYPAAALFHFLLILPQGIELPESVARRAIFSTHPQMSAKSFEAADKMVEFIKFEKPDRITVLLSGGASALLEKSDNPQKTIELNSQLLKSGKPIVEINKIRGENSLIKNGKLAERFGKIKWLVFVMNDIPYKFGAKLVGSMPFFREDLPNTKLSVCADSNSLHDKLLDYFKEPPVSIRNYSDSLDNLSDLILRHIKSGTKKLAITGEPLLKTDCDKTGIGGRMSHLALKILPYLNNSANFYALSSDGIDGNSPYAGAVVKNHDFTLNKDERENALKCYNSAYLLNKYGFMLKSGITGINLNDFIDRKSVV